MENTPKEREEGYEVGPTGWKHVKGDPGQEVLFDPNPADMPWPDEDPNHVSTNDVHDEDIQEAAKEALREPPEPQGPS